MAFLLIFSNLAWSIIVIGQDEHARVVAYDDDTRNIDTGKLSVTSEQQKILLALLQGSNTLSSHSVNPLTTNSPLVTSIIFKIPSLIQPKTFILFDTETTNHICNSIKKFQCLKRVKHIHIKSPNGSIVSTSLAGTVIFYQKIYLTMFYIYLNSHSISFLYLNSLNIFLAT
jgi:hypothetical protein